MKLPSVRTSHVTYTFYFLKNCIPHELFPRSLHDLDSHQGRQADSRFCYVNHIWSETKVCYFPCLPLGLLLRPFILAFYLWNGWVPLWNQFVLVSGIVWPLDSLGTGVICLYKWSTMDISAAILLWVSSLTISL